MSALANLSVLADALATMAQVIPNCDDAARGFTCSEAVSIADVLSAAGYAKEAYDFIVQHAYGDDDEDDLHHDLFLTLVGASS